MSKTVKELKLGDSVVDADSVGTLTKLSGDTTDTSAIVAKINEIIDALKGSNS